MGSSDGRAIKEIIMSPTTNTDFGRELHLSESRAIAEASEIATRTQTPCGVWHCPATGWYTVCDIAPELIEPDPERFGWRLWAVVDP